MTFLKTSHDGEATVDHTASPGLPPAMAVRAGMPPELLGEGTVMNAPALGCPHCGSVVILNPMRKRPRANCIKCNKYICDICDAVRNEPDYIHITIEEIAAKVHSGKWRLVGSMSKPILVPVED